MVTIKKLDFLEMQLKIKLNLQQIKLNNKFLKKNHVLQQYLQLIKYQEEYYKHLHVSILKGINISTWKCYIKFLNMIDRNIILQKKILLQYSDEIKKIHNIYRKNYCKIQIYKNLKLLIYKHKILKNETLFQKNDDILVSLHLLRQVKDCHVI
ncbi:Flagellar FliJ protein [Buchnera aphidicola (Eriosoma lanigerum)]|uniref:flagellar FliJ family protein n=1 Tax=Buchnera aphidicola TaxID=9 RepID=UPI003463D646